jgi:hypothetical protein
MIMGNFQETRNVFFFVVPFAMGNEARRKERTATEVFPGRRKDTYEMSPAINDLYHSRSGGPHLFGKLWI